MFNIYSNIIYNENITYKNIKNIIYNCKSQNTLLSHFFTLLLRPHQDPKLSSGPTGRLTTPHRPSAAFNMPLACRKTY